MDNSTDGGVPKANTEQSSSVTSAPLPGPPTATAAKRKRSGMMPEVDIAARPSPSMATSVHSRMPPNLQMSYSETAGVYAQLLRLRRKRDMDCTPLIPLPSHTVGGLRDQIEKMKQCNCKRSYCLKLYCECFASGIHCNALCNCASCRNNDIGKNTQHRTNAIIATLERNPHAFRPRALAIAGAAAAAAGAGGLELSVLQSPGRDGNGSTGALGEPSTPSSVGSPSHHAGKESTAATSSNRKDSLGCNCKKSHCLKNAAEAAAAAAALAHQHSRLANSMNSRMGMMGEGGRTYYGVGGAGAGAMKGGGATMGGVLDGGSGGPGGTDSLIDGGAPGSSQSGAGGTTGALVVAGAAAGGLDVFLPPSSYAVPMQLSNGVKFPGLSFGTAGRQNMGVLSPNFASSSGPAASSSGSGAVGAPNSSSASVSSPSSVPNSPGGKSVGKHSTSSPMRPPPSPSLLNRRYKYGWKRRAGIPGGRVETGLEKRWREEIDTTRLTFDAIRDQIKNRHSVGGASESSEVVGDHTDTASTPIKESTSILQNHPPTFSINHEDVTEVVSTPTSSGGVVDNVVEQKSAPSSPTSRKSMKRKKLSKIELEKHAKLEEKKVIEKRANSILLNVEKGMEQVLAATECAKAGAIRCLDRVDSEQINAVSGTKVGSTETSLDSKEADDSGGRNVTSLQSDGSHENGNSSGSNNTTKKALHETSSVVESQQDGTVVEDELLSDLKCSETIASLPSLAPKTELSEHALRELIILAAQDASLLQELSRQIKAKAINMAANRMKNNK
eukprot:scaffold32329_cov43-Attheya_sp.AAC.2